MALRFVLEFFRGDFRGSQLFGMSIAQVLSIFIFVAGIIIIYKVSKNAEKIIYEKFERERVDSFSFRI